MMKKVEEMALRRVRQCIKQTKVDDIYDLLVQETVTMSDQELRVKILQSISESLNRLNMELKEANEWIECLIEK